MQGSQEPWPVRIHESTISKEPSDSIGSLRQPTNPKDAPSSLRAVPVQCGKHCADCLARDHLLHHISDLMLGTHGRSYRQEHCSRQPPNPGHLAS